MTSYHISHIFMRLLRPRNEPSGNWNCWPMREKTSNAKPVKRKLHYRILFICWSDGRNHNTAPQRCQVKWKKSTAAIMEWSLKQSGREYDVWDEYAINCLQFTIFRIHNINLQNHFLHSAWNTQCTLHTHTHTKFSNSFHTVILTHNSYARV